jgi:hypothetical protein
MHVRFRGCVGNLVLPYYSVVYLYSILNLPCVMIGYNKYRVDYLWPINRFGTSFGSAEPREPYPLPCLNLITYIITLTT